MTLAWFVLLSVQSGVDLQPREPREAIAEAPITVLEGRVETNAGWPAAGAVVVTDSGGKAVTGEDGWFRLEVQLPREPGELRVTAVQGSGVGGTFGSVVVAAPRAGGVLPVGVLRLSQRGACVPSWLPSFGTALGTDASVHALAVFDDGTGPALYVGGDFERAGSVQGNGIAKWDGTRWSSLGGGFVDPVPDDFVDVSVEALAVFDDGNGPRLYAGGYLGGSFFFSDYLARWNGTSWQSLGVNGFVHALAVFDDGGGPSLYAGGEFTQAGFVAMNHVGKWKGSAWSALGSGTDDDVLALTVFDDGGGPALFAGGLFTAAGGAPASRVAKWDGSSWTALGTGANNTVRALTVFDDGSGPALYAGGLFRHAGGLACERIARWDGASWSALGSGLDREVRALTVFHDGGGPALFAAGTFTVAGGLYANRVARWDGAAWSAVGGGTSGFVDALAAFDDGGGAGPKLFAGGGFAEADGLEVQGLAGWDGAGWTPVGAGSPFGNATRPEIQTLTVFDAGSGNGPELYAGGDFTMSSGAVDIARWDGETWSALGSGLSNGNALCSTVFDDGGGPALYVGGFFSTAGGAPAANIATWNGSSWFALGSGTNAFVGDLTVFDDGGGEALYAAGTFTSAGGAAAQRIARWDGAGWSPLASGLDNTVQALTVFDDGSGPALYAGGDFSNAGGASASRIARWDGASWSALGGGIGGTSPLVSALAVFDDGNGPALYAGGRFTTAGGSPAAGIARWDGAGWSALGGGIGGTSPFVTALTAFDDGSGPALYAGGSFTSAGGLPAAHSARWDGTTWAPLGSGMSNATVLAFAVHLGSTGDFALFAGGDFFGALDSGDSYLARWQGCRDGTAPTFPPLPDWIVREQVGSPPGEIVTFSVTATDNQDPAPAIVCTPPSGSLFPPGVTIVQCSATDATGNQASASFRAIVRSNVR